ncbi:OmpA family protein, partial [bacterium]
MKKLAALMLILSVMCLMASPVAAGERAGALSLSPYVGGYTFDGVQHLETAPVHGLRIGYDVTDNFGVELVGSYLATTCTLCKKTSVNALSYRLDLLYNFLPAGPLVPYLAVGGGAITKGHGASFHGGSNTDATANAGLGLKYFLTDSIA